jgi:hypothetical protein
VEYAYVQRRVLELRSQGYTVDLLSTQETHTDDRAGAQPRGVGIVAI